MTRLSITAKPGSKKPGIEIHDGTIVVRVKERAVEGAANAACLRAIAEWLDVGLSSLSIVRGATSKQKLVQVANLTPLELNDRISEISLKASSAAKRAPR